jgi:hypothetical protein
MKKLITLSILLFSLQIMLNAQSNVGISDEESQSPDPSAVLDVYSISKGMLVPRLTDIQMNDVADPATGLLIFNTDTYSFHFYNGTSWVDLTSSSDIWDQNAEDVFLSDETKNVGIGTSDPGSKFVVQADADDLDSDILFEVKDKLGNTVFEVTSGGVRAYVKDPVKGVSGGFAVGKYGAAKGLGDLLLVTSDSTRVYTNANGKGVSGGFAVGKYGAAKESNGKYFFTNLDSTRVYTGDPVKGVSGGFAVGKYGAAKGTDSIYFHTTLDSTRVYVNEAGKGISGGFAVGKYGAAKNTGNKYFYTGYDSTRVYVPEGITSDEIGGFAVTGNNAGVINDYFNVTGNTGVDIVDNENRIMWYPQKSAFLGGEVHVASADSVGTNSVALGYRSISMGDWSQAFGYRSLAYGTYSTAIGYRAEAGTNSLSVGYSAEAIGNSSFAMGYGALAEGDNSYALGSIGQDSSGIVTTNTHAFGAYSFAFGLGSVSNGKGSIAFGTNNISDGEYSTAIGYKNNATKYYSTSMGAYSNATGDFSTAIGFFTSSTKIASTALGYATEANGEASFAVGEFSIAGGDFFCSHGLEFSGKRQQFICNWEQYNGFKFRCFCNGL